MKIKRIQNLFLITILLIMVTSCSQVETTYYPDNRISSEVTMKYNKKNGRARYYYTNGSLQQETYFKDDKAHGILRRWKATGILLCEERYTEGLKNGIASTWDEKGHKVSLSTYRNDTLDGLSKEWYETGSLRLEGNYKQGMFEGRWIWLSQEGKIVGEGNFSKGTGIVKSFYLNGKLAAITPYTSNEKDGQEVAWDDSGNIKLKRQWKMGRIVIPDSISQQASPNKDNIK